MRCGCLAEAAAIDPTAQHLTFLAQAQNVSGDIGGAEQTLRRALEVDPQYAYSYTVLESLLVSQGRTAEAAELKDLALLHGVTIDRLRRERRNRLVVGRGPFPQSRAVGQNHTKLGPRSVFSESLPFVVSRSWEGEFTYRGGMATA